MQSIQKVEVTSSKAFKSYKEPTTPPPEPEPEVATEAVMESEEVP